MTIEAFDDQSGLHPDSLNHLEGTVIVTIPHSGSEVGAISITVPISDAVDGKEAKIKAFQLASIALSKLANKFSLYVEVEVERIRQE